MPASYPAAVKVFTAHKNNIEDIDASHVNSLQDEVSATETVLGTFPQIDPTLNGKFNDYGTVRGRLEQISRGTHLPVVSVARNNTQQTVPQNSLTNIVWDTVLADPFNTYSSGVDVVVPFQGWWIWVAQARFSAKTDSTQRFATLVHANRYGTNPSNTANHQWISSNNVTNDPNGFTNLGFGTQITLSTQGVYPKGSIIRLYASHGVSPNLGMLGVLQGCCLRTM